MYYRPRSTIKSAARQSLAQLGWLPLLLAFVLATQVAMAQGTQPPQAAQVQKTVTNNFSETEVRQALADVASSVGLTVVADATVQGTVTCDLKDVPFEKALDILTASGGYSWVKTGDIYLVGLADPTNPNFSRFATTLVFKPDYAVPQRLLELLSPSFSTYVKAPKEANVLTITAAPTLASRILADLKLLDQAPTKIMLEALVTEASTEVLDKFDFSWAWKHFGASTSDQGFDLKYSEVSQSDVASIKSLISNGKADVRANPRIMTVEGKEASIEIAQESYFQVVSGPVNFPYTTLQLIKTGISLKMTPRLTSDGRITVDLAPEVSDATGSGAAGLPINTARRASTTVRVKDGETIIIGGMTYESNRRKDMRVPILSELPFIGSLFRSHRYETKKTEVVIMITPRVVRDTESTGRESPKGG